MRSIRRSRRQDDFALLIRRGRSVTIAAANRNVIGVDGRDADSGEHNVDEACRAIGHRNLYRASR